MLGTSSRLGEPPTETEPRLQTEPAPSRRRTPFILSHLAWFGSRQQVAGSANCCARASSATAGRPLRSSRRPPVAGGSFEGLEKVSGMTTRGPVVGGPKCLRAATGCRMRNRFSMARGTWRVPLGGQSCCCCCCCCFSLAVQTKKQNRQSTLIYSSHQVRVFFLIQFQKALVRVKPPTPPLWSQMVGVNEAMPTAT